MRRTKLNVVPQASAEIALGQIINGDQVMSLSGHKAALTPRPETYAPDNYVAAPGNEAVTSARRGPARFLSSWRAFRLLPKIRAGGQTDDACDRRGACRNPGV